MTQTFLDGRNPGFKAMGGDPRDYTAPYRFEEYPKWVMLPDGSGVTVENEAEERAARGDDSVAETSNEGQVAASVRPPRVRKVTPSGE